MYEKFSRVIYEGDTILIFGLLSFNVSNDTWEFENPIAIIKTAKLDFFLNLIKTKQSLVGFESTFFTFAAAAAFGFTCYIGYKLYHQFKHLR